MLETARHPIHQLAESLGIVPEKIGEIGMGEGDAFEYLPSEIREVLPKLYSQEQVQDEHGRPNPLVILKLFLPGTGWTWYFTEGESQEDDFTFFGFTVGSEGGEFGYTSLKEISEFRTRMRLRAERDLHFRPCRLREIEEITELL